MGLGALGPIMKIAIFGDIHANLEALETVLADSRNLGCSEWVCIGDVVGYNANPHECLAIVRDLASATVKGNHDEEASLDTAIEGLNPLAHDALEWTRRNLSEEDKEWLRNLRFVQRVHDFTVVHATLDSPETWHYVLNRFDAMVSLNYQYTPVCFYGHTHTPCSYIKESQGRVERRTDMLQEIRPAGKYFINVGSVGQPRDGDWRSSYVIYDTDKNQVRFRRLEYDFATTQEKIRAAGLPEMLATRLEFGK